MPQSNHKTQVAIYARVSTKDKQGRPNQLRELRRWTKKMGYKIYQEYIDNEGGSKGRGQRQQFTPIFQDAAQRKFDLVLLLGARPLDSRAFAKNDLLPAVAR